MSSAFKMSSNMDLRIVSLTAIKLNEISLLFNGLVKQRFEQLALIGLNTESVRKLAEQACPSFISLSFC